MASMRGTDPAADSQVPFARVDRASPLALHLAAAYGASLDSAALRAALDALQTLPEQPTAATLRVAADRAVVQRHRDILQQAASAATRLHTLHNAVDRTAAQYTALAQRVATASANAHVALDASPTLRADTLRAMSTSVPTTNVTTTATSSSTPHDTLPPKPPTDTPIEPE